MFESPHQLHNKTLLASANRVFDIYILNIKYYMWRKGMNEYSDDLLFAGRISLRMSLNNKTDFDIIYHQLSVTGGTGRFDICAAAAALERDNMRADDFKTIGTT